MSKYVRLKEDSFTGVLSLGPCSAVFVGFDRQFLARWRTAEKEGPGSDVAWPFVSITVESCPWQ